MQAPSKIIELRALLAEKHPAAALKGAGFLPTGLAQADETLHGGLPLGSLTEIVCPCAGGLLLNALIHSNVRQRALMALIDGRDAFDCDSLPAAALRRLMWVRVKTPPHAVQAADLLLRDGNLSLVVMDLRSHSARETGKIPASSWYRLQKVVEPNSTAFAVLTRQPLIGAARPRLTVHARFTLDAFELRQTDLLARLHVELARGAVEQMPHYA